MAELSEQEQIRRNSLNELKKLGINPYPADLYEVNVTSSDIHTQFPNDNTLFQNVSIAGRIMSRRIMGAASFVELQDANGRIQLYIKRDEICPGEDKTMYNTVFKRLLDIGDIVGVTGFVFITQMGEISIHVKSLTVLSKSLRPLPIVKEKDGQVFDAFQDPEQRYRMRYVDLIVNPQVRKVFEQRATIINTMRNYFNEQGYLEVDTPVLQSIPGGAAARPFITHHNALDIDLYLRIANELYLKRLIVGGYAGVYEFSRNFRNEGMDRTHNPEFTCMEIYVAYKDYKWMMKFVENMIERIAVAINGKTKFDVWGNEIEFKAPYRKLPMLEAIKEYAGVDIAGMDEAALRDTCRKLNVPVTPQMGVGKLIDAIFGEYCEKNLIQPTFITDYPVEMSPLTKRHRENPNLTERFELFVNGKSMGRQKKLSKEEAEAVKGKDEFWMQRRYRLMWTDVKYEPGEVKVVTYGKDGKKMGEKTMRTAGKPYALKLNRLVATEHDNIALKANGEDLAYVTVSVVDKDGNPCPTATDLVQFNVKGAGKFRAAGNGDATCLDLFHLPQHHLFAGKCTAIVQSGKNPGTVTIEASAKGLKGAKLMLKVE